MKQDLMIEVMQKMSRYETGFDDRGNAKDGNASG